MSFVQPLAASLLRGSTVLFLLFASHAMPLCGAADSDIAPIAIRGKSPGRLFDGLGVVSAGGSSRLLYDYPEQQRSEILDYLFKPGYGASLQILKIEIGGDLNSTSGAEPSHMRAPKDLNWSRGYEWWLAKEAKARNPNIILMGLAWGTPGWVKGGFWSDDNIAYLIKWLDCAAVNGIKIDYMGGWNERRFDVEWYIKMSRAVKQKYPHVRIIGSDDVAKIWDFAHQVSVNPELRSAIDVIGVHSPCGWRSAYKNCPSPDYAVALNKPLWTSETSAQGHDIGSMPHARAINRSYINGKLTAYMVWSPVTAWYPNLPLADTGLILAEWPWSGHYQIGKSVWVFAHTAQFVKPGWRYLDESCGMLQGGGSYVSLKSSMTNDYTVVIETCDMQEPETIRFTTSEDLSTRPVAVWATDLRSNDPQKHFVRYETLEPRERSFKVTLKPGHVYTLSTTTGQTKGNAVPPASPSVQLPLPFTEHFDSYKPGQLARFFSDIAGGFETAPAAGDRKGMAYRQCTTTPPVAWTPGTEADPTTLVGDPNWWGDYELSCDVLLEEPGFVELLARVACQKKSRTPGYHLRLADSGIWRLYNQTEREDITLSSGTAQISVGTWHRVVFKLSGTQLQVSIDGRQVASIRDDYHKTGQVGLRSATGMRAQFDDLSIVRTLPAPEFVPHQEMRVSATSEHARWYRGWEYAAANAIDARPDSIWSTDWEPTKPKLPQSITIDLGKSRDVHGLVYWPRLDRTTDGMPTKYKIGISSDGQSFQSVAQGTWLANTSTKTSGWPKCRARYVRFEVLESVKGMASAAGIDIALSPLVEASPK